MNERDIAAEIAEGMKEVPRIRACKHNWVEDNFAHKWRSGKFYVYRCTRCNAASFAELTEERTTMSKQTEALKLALEYLRDNQHYIADNERHAYVMEYNAFVERLEALAEQPAQDNTYGYAKNLAEAVFKQHFASDEHYASGRVVWGVNDTVIGILTQIDNMVADMVRRPAQQEQDRQIDQLIQERDHRDEIIDKLCDAVLGPDRYEWSSQYFFEDAVREVEERMAALEQPAQDQGQSCYCPECERLSKELDAIKAQQPVAWMHTNAIGHVYFRKNPQDKTLNPVPLYTSPPASKPWVGLTQQDIDIAFDDTQEGGGFNEFARAIEAKLREKNT